MDNIIVRDQLRAYGDIPRDLGIIRFGADAIVNSQGSRPLSDAELDAIIDRSRGEHTSYGEVLKGAASSTAAEFDAISVADEGSLRQWSAENGHVGTKRPLDEASSGLVSGGEAEVVILDGEHQGQWLGCRITGPGSSAGTYNIYVLPTEAYDNAVGLSGEHVPDISAEHLRSSDRSAAPHRKRLRTAAA